MNMNGKQMYESPATEVVVVTQERFICASEMKGRIKTWGNGDFIEEELNIEVNN